jgi:Leucine-rich repeat (LRR) protein
MDISENNLLRMPEAIGDVGSLRRFVANNNKIELVPDSFGKLTRLEMLELQMNQIKDLGENFGNCTALQHLNLSCNHIMMLPLDIGRMTRLYVLDVSCNHLNRLPESMGELHRLKVLKPARNDIVQLPTTFCQCTSLVELDVSRNKLMALPDAIGDLTALQILDAGNNRIKRVSGSIGCLWRLGQMSLRGNLLQRIPNEIGSCTSLASLDLSHNRLRGCLPIGLGTIYSLMSLDLSYNRLEALPANVGALKMMSRLNLAHNLISDLPETIGRLPNLTDLNLQANKLKYVPHSIGRATELLRLDLSANQLELLPSELALLTKLRSLDLYNNRLVALPIDLGRLIPEMDNFSAGRNPLTNFPKKWCTTWELKDQYETLWSGYRNEELVDMLVALSKIYPALEAAWDEIMAEKQGVHAHVYLEKVKRLMQGDWRKRFEPLVRQFVKQCQKDGSLPVYSQLLPEETKRREFERVDRRKRQESHVSNARRLSEEYNRRLAVHYAVTDEALERGESVVANRARISAARAKVTLQEEVKALRGLMKRAAEKQARRQWEIEVERRALYEQQVKDIGERVKERIAEEKRRRARVALEAEISRRGVVHRRLLTEEEEATHGLEQARLDAKNARMLVDDPSFVFAPSAAKAQMLDDSARCQERLRLVEDEHAAMIATLADNNAWFSHNKIPPHVVFLGMDMPTRRRVMDFSDHCNYTIDGLLATPISTRWKRRQKKAGRGVKSGGVGALARDAVIGAGPKQRRAGAAPPSAAATDDPRPADAGRPRLPPMPETGFR